MKSATFAVIGGDLRSIYLAKFLQNDRNKVYMYGFDKKQELCDELKVIEDLAITIVNADVIIGAIPCSNDDETVNAPFSSSKIYIREVLGIMTPQQLFMAGRITDKIKYLAKFLNVNCIDLLDREELSVLNAVPTSEGAIQIAMENMSTTLHGSNALVLGFGRIGKTLAKMLKGIGAKVTVAARKYSDIAWINTYGYTSIHISTLKYNVSDMDVIFNTVPSLIMDEHVLKRVSKQSILVDLASNPGGIELKKAEELGLNVHRALSLPGKVAPETAAKFIKDTICNVISELDEYEEAKE